MLNFTFASDYAIHRFKANNRHGIHSPFVYNLIDTVIYDYSDQKIYHDPNKHTNPGRTDIKTAQLIYRLVRHFNPANIIQVGKLDDLTSLYIKKAVPNAKHLSLGISEEAVALKDLKFDMVVFYLDYQESNYLKSIELCMPQTDENTVMIFKGIYENAGAKIFWQQVKQHPGVRLTINLFWIGLVFFKSGRAEKEHFRVKY